MRKSVVLLATIIALFGSAAADAQKRTYINPIDIDYRYNWEQSNEGVS